MLSKVLIANRGEIALRILRACRDLHIPSVVVYSEADRESLAVLLAEESVCIGPPQSSKSYLSIPNILSAALMMQCDAIHPGYGFLAENRYFAELCGEYNLTFIGPRAEAIDRVANKAAARREMGSVGLPVLPGTEGSVSSLEEAQSAAMDIGYPVILKAAAGGGGRGMRVARTAKELTDGFQVARVEARTSFGNDEVYLERYLEHCRHVEVQILGDLHGNIVHLAERECSIQRRHQKIVEEAPCPSLTDHQREYVGSLAVRGAQALSFTGAGTLEFLLDDTGAFFFMEMNTRVQVEHGITELITGVDIVREQLLIAAGEPLSFAQEDVRVQGHAIECRITSETGPDFRPATGRVEQLMLPGGPGVRVDTQLYPGYVIPAHYDSLIAKVMAHGHTRDEAIARMQRALLETRIEGVPNTVAVLQNILDDPLFQQGRVFTDYLEGRA